MTVRMHHARRWYGQKKGLFKGTLLIEQRALL